MRKSTERYQESDVVIRDAFTTGEGSIIDSPQAIENDMQTVPKKYAKTYLKKLFEEKLRESLMATTTALIRSREAQDLTQDQRQETRITEVCELTEALNEKLAELVKASKR